MFHQPAQMLAWRRRAAWLADGFVSNSKRTAQQIQVLMEFCNGDTAEDLICHYCTGPACCQSDEEAAEKFLKLLLPVLGKGYPLPLLYRFKHYAPASSYVKTFSCFHNLLPRVLEQMDRNATDKVDASSDLGKVIDDFLTGDRVDADALGPKEFQSLLTDLLDNDLDYAVQNGARKKLVLKEIRKPGFCQAAFLIDILVAPMEYGSNLLFKRTSLLTEIAALSRAHPDYTHKTKTSSQMFLDIVSGRLGRELMKRYTALLDTSEALQMGLNPSDENLALLFQQVVICVTDLWRRMVLEFDCFPYKVFALLNDFNATQSADPDMDSFTHQWEALHDLLQSCPRCFDLEFSTPLLQGIGRLTGLSAQDKAASVEEVCSLLRSVACYAPINADSVEVKHGQLQWTVSKRGGQYVKRGRAGTEVSLLRSAIMQSAMAQRFVDALTRPAANVAAGIRNQVGVLSTNQAPWLTSASSLNFCHASFVEVRARAKACLQGACGFAHLRLLRLRLSAPPTSPRRRTSIAWQQPRTKRFAHCLDGTCLSKLVWKIGSSARRTTSPKWHNFPRFGRTCAQTKRKPTKLRPRTSNHCGLSWNSSLLENVARRSLSSRAKLADLVAKSCPSSDWPSTRSSFSLIRSGSRQPNLATATWHGLVRFVFVSRYLFFTALITINRRHLAFKPFKSCVFLLCELRGLYGSTPFYTD